MNGDATAAAAAAQRERARRARGWCERHRIEPVSVCGIDSGKSLLSSADDRVFHEVATNLWADVDASSPAAVYLGTGKHQGGLVLRPLYVDFGEGWVNVTTGKPAPKGMIAPRDGG